MNRGARILVVDDREPSRYCVVHCLEQAGYEVLQASSAAAGLARAQADKPSLVVLDVQLADGNGLELCRELKRDPRTAAIPVIQVSAVFRSPEDRALGIESGAAAYLTTPFEPREVLALVAGLLRQCQAEAQLRESERRYRALAANLPDGAALILDQDLLCIMAAGPVLERAGIPPESLQGQPVCHSLPAAIASHCEDLCRRALAGEPFELEHEYRGRCYLARGVPLRDENGRVEAVLAVTYDITNRKSAEEALRDQENRLRLAKNAAALGIHEYDPVSGAINWDERVRELWGIDPDQTISFDLFMAGLHPDDRAATQAAVDRALDPSGDGAYLAEYRVVNRRDGQTRWIAATGKVTFEDGKPVRLVGTVQDISPQKNFEEDLERLVVERTAKLGEALAELEHFSYSIIHDLRAPLRSMRGFAELAREALEGDSLEATKCLDRIVKSAQRMDHLITDALAYSQAVRRELPLAPVDPGNLLRELLVSYPELLAFQHRIAIEGEFPQVLANDAGLTQCFSNFLRNAIKFAQPGTELKVRIWAERTPESGPPDEPSRAPQPHESETVPPAEFTDGSAQTYPGWVRIWIEDNGIGIPENMVPRVFNMFVRGTNDPSGTGIGLALVRKAVDRMGGRVGVESVLGEGSRFWMDLRAAPEPSRAAKQLAGQ